MDGSSGARPPARQLDALTSLRFFAAGLVVLHHIQGGLGVPFVSPSNGARGVSLFFVLSGFILAYKYPVMLPGGWKAFLLRRFARIWPAHAIATLFALLAIPGALQAYPPGPMVAYLLTNLAMVHAWLPFMWADYAINGPSWSISTEFGFYLLFPLLIADFRRTWWWKLALAFALLAVLIVICNAVAVNNAPSPTDGLNTISIFYYSPLTQVVQFLSGMCAALAWRRWGASLRVPTLLATLAELASIWFFVTNPVGSYLFTHFSVLNSGAGGQWFAPSGGSMIVSNVVLIFVLACGGGWVSRLLSLPFLVLLGEISYSIYLFHVPLLRLYAANAGLFGRLPDWIVLVGYVAAVIGVSWLVFRLVERPARSWILGKPLQRQLGEPAHDAQRHQ